MSEDRRVGSQAPLWRLGSPTLVWRVGWPLLGLFGGSLAIVVFGPGGPGSGFVVAAWVFGCAAGMLVLGALLGYVVRWRMSKRVKEYAMAEGLGFAVRAPGLTGGWRIAPDCDGALSRDVVTGTVRGHPLTSFLHQSYVDSGRSRASAAGLAARHVLGVRVVVLDVGRRLPSVELTPQRLLMVEKRSLPTDDSVALGIPEIDDYHVRTDDPAFAAALLSGPVLAALGHAPQLAVRTSGTRLIVLASPLTKVDGLAAGVRLLATIGARLDEVPAAEPATVAAQGNGPTYVPPSPRRWRLAPFGQPYTRTTITDERRGVLGDRPYLTFVHERVVGTGKDQQRQREQVIALALPARLPRLEVWPDTVVRQLAPSLALREDIEIESDEFNRRFQVAAADRKYAVDVLNPRAVAALLAVPDFAWRIDGSDLVGLWNATTGPDEVHARLRALDAVAAHLPRHLVTDHGWTTEPSDVDTGTADLDATLPPVRPSHVVLATIAGLIVVGAGVPIALAVTDDRPGAWLGGIVVVVVIATVAVGLTVIGGRVADNVRRLSALRRQDVRRRA